MKYALIGCGRIATNHVKAVVNNKLEFAAVCDVVPEQMEALLAKHGLEKDSSIARYTDYKKMIEEVQPELVGIATESGIHAEIALYCIDHGVNCIIEKPIAMSMEDADEIVRRSEEKHVKVAACHQNRFNIAVQEARKALDVTGKQYGCSFDYTDLLMGGASIDVNGVPLTDETIEKAKASDAVLMGSIGGDAKTSPWYKLSPDKRPEAGLLKLRKSLNLFANVRPAYLYEELKAACPLRDEIIGDGFDLVIMRELTGGLYFGERKTIEENGVKKAIDTLTYSETEIRRIARRGFDIAMKRRKKVTSVDKANVLDSSRLWRSVVEEVAKDYPEVTLEHMLVDNCAMQLVRDPKQFDVILTENMFGDILSDEASMVTGSIGMLSSASLNETKFGLYEPSHGSAPDIAGQDKANPIATILSAAMMLRFSLDLDEAADAIEAAVKQVLKDGYRTGDIMSEGCTLVGTVKMGDLIAERIQ